MAKISRAPSGHRCGSSHHRAKLTSEQVAEIRKAYEGGTHTYMSLAAQFGCGLATVRDIVQYRTRLAG